MNHGADRLPSMPAGVAQQVDVDLWVLEPSGSLYIPWLGSITPNGTLTDDSFYNSTFYEGYLTNRFVLDGIYTFYGNLWSDPNDFRPLFDLAFRSDQVSAFSWLYDPNLPQLSLQSSCLSDPDPTFVEADAFAYTDLQPVATITYGPTPARQFSAVRPGSQMSQSLRAEGQRPTAAQLATIRRAVLAQRQRGARASTGSETFFGRLPSWKRQ